MVKVSIVMPVYNGYNFLEKSIESVAKQTLKDVELICIDDGSTDKSLELLNELSEKYGFIKILTQKNQGSGIARNNGIKIDDDLLFYICSVFQENLTNIEHIFNEFRRGSRKK